MLPGSVRRGTGAVELSALAKHATRSSGTSAPKDAAHTHTAPSTGSAPATRSPDRPSVDEHCLCHTPRLVGRVRRAGCDAARRHCASVSYDPGGHFAAMEQPDLLVGDVRTFFRNLRDRRRNHHG